MIIRARSIGLVAVCLLIGSAPLLHSQNAARPELEIRFCPRGPLWTYPLDEVHGVHGMLVQNAAIINHGAPVTITSVDLELLENGVVNDVRHLTKDDIAGLGAAAPQISTLLQLVPSQFCGENMVPHGVALAGPTLPREHALIVLQEPFAFTGERDALRITAHAKRAGRTTQWSNEVQIARSLPPGENTFPLQGAWYIANGPSLHTAHRWGVAEEFAFDIVKLYGQGRSHSGTGARFADYYAYDSPVLAMAGGRVIDVVNDVREDSLSMIGPTESKEAYAARLQRDQTRRLKQGLRGLMGNYVVVEQAPGQFALYAHLKPGSVLVRKGQDVAQRQALGRLGSSGNSTEPHLHVQLCDGPDPMMCAGIPLRFVHVLLPQADALRALQTGDFVVSP